MADDILWSTIYLGNFSDIDTDEGNTQAENPGLLVGTYGSEIDPLWDHITTIDTDSTSNAVREDNGTGEGTMTYDVGGGSVTTSMDTYTQYNATITYSDASTATVVVVVVQATNGDVFVLNTNADGSWSTTKPIWDIELLSENANGFIGTTQTYAATNEFVACFTEGTMVDTPDGAVPVETLQPGDPVMTLDQGICPTRWIGRWTISRADMVANAKKRPVLIEAGALRQGHPSQPVLVSRQHRILITSKIAERMFGAPEILVAASQLESIPGVRSILPDHDITFVHLLFEDHQIVKTHGLFSESMLIAPGAVQAIDQFQLITLITRFPQHFSNADAMAPARPIIRGARLRTLISRHLRNGHPIQLNAPWPAEQAA